SLLHDRLSSLPQDAADRSVAFYAEMLDDRIEDGMSEEDAVESMETVDIIAERIILDTPLPALLRERIRPKGGMTALNATLLILGAPVWLPLVLAVLAVIAAVFVTIWSVVAALFAAVIGLGAGGLLALVVSPLNFSSGVPQGLLLAGFGLFSIGVSIFAFFGSAAAAGSLIRLTVLLSRWLRARFIPSTVRERGLQS